VETNQIGLDIALGEIETNELIPVSTGTELPELVL
jgi:hypothetical protein